MFRSPLTDGVSRVQKSEIQSLGGLRCRNLGVSRARSHGFQGDTLRTYQACLLPLISCLLLGSSATCSYLLGASATYSCFFGTSATCSYLLGASATYPCLLLLWYLSHLLLPPRDLCYLLLPPASLVRQLPTPTSWVPVLPTPASCFLGTSATYYYSLLGTFVSYFCLLDTSVLSVGLLPMRPCFLLLPASSSSPGSHASHFTPKNLLGKYNSSLLLPFTCCLLLSLCFLLLLPFAF